MKLHLLLVTLLALNPACTGEAPKKSPEPEIDPASEFQTACVFYETGGLAGAKQGPNTGQRDVDFFFTRVCRSAICQSNHFFTLTARLESYRLEQKYRRFRKFLTDQGIEARCEAVERTLDERRRETLSALVKCLVPPLTPGVFDDDERSLPACLGRAFVKPAMRHAQTPFPSKTERERPPEPEPAVTPPEDPIRPEASRAAILEALQRPSPDPLSSDFAVSAKDLNPEVICGFTAADFRAVPVERETLSLLGDECRRLVRKVVELAALNADACAVAKRLLEQEAGGSHDAATGRVRTSLDRECARRERAAAAQLEAQEPTAPTQDGAKPQTAPTLGGTIDTRALQKTISDHRREAMQCYQKALKQGLTFSGTFRTRFVIELNGQVSSCDLVERLPVKALSDCICTQIKTWQFPKPQHDRVQVQFPWVFKSME